ncbi:hypothetical protein OK016_17830 [Vibrio chagasii]|nr:hypothetical protein [Vibrio chagasii]
MIKNVKSITGIFRSIPKRGLIGRHQTQFRLGNYINEGKIDLALGNPYHKTSYDFNVEGVISR